MGPDQGVKMDIPVDRPRNVTWTGPNQESGHIQFMWGDSSDPVPRGFRIEVKTTDGRGLRHQDEARDLSYEASRDRAIRIMKDMMRSLENPR